MGFLPLLFKLNPWRDYEKFPQKTPAERHNFVIGRLEEARPREWRWVVVVAGIGFFTDAYSIFSVNMVTPMLGYVYWGHPSLMPHGFETALSIVTLGGALLGQIAFGVGADIWGRRKMYGLELLILTFTTIGVATSSPGVEGSMSIEALLLVWRFFMGVGLGGDYPPSAVICSEFAPTRLRGRMLAAVFLCQSLGQLAATFVALVAVLGFQHQLPTDPSIRDCAETCARTVDSIWRLIIGLGAVPAFIALWFRLTMIESPRYTAEVTQNSVQAAADISQYWLRGEEVGTPDGSSIVDQISVRRVDSARASSAEAETDIRRVSSAGVSRPASGLYEIEDELIDFSTIWRRFSGFLYNKRAFRILLATSLCWFCLDLPFYGLGLLSPEVINTIWFGANVPAVSIYQNLLRTSYQSLVVVSSGAIVGSILSLLTIDRLGRRNIQLNGFFWLFILQVVIGASFKHLVLVGDSSALVVMYILSQIFFNFGPNATTYIIPAELFPTQLRCTGHGISAASGKLGSVIAQLFLAYVNFGHGANYTNVPDWLGYVLLCLSFFMALGFLITYFFIPEIRDTDGRVKSLEELAEVIEPKADHNSGHIWLANGLNEEIRPAVPPSDL